MDFFFRNRQWYAGQFVRKIVPRENLVLTPRTTVYLSTVLNKQKKVLLSVLVRNVDETFNNLIVKLPTKNNEIDFDFMEDFVRELEEERVRELTAYLAASGLDDYELSEEEEKILESYKCGSLSFDNYTYESIFNHIKQGRRLKKEDQKPGSIPFVMSGTTNNGVVGFISNPVASFPKNSITLDIFGNAFYREYEYGAGDDTGVYWNDEKSYSKETMLFLTASMEKSIRGKFDFGKKLRSSQSFKIKMKLPSKNGQADLASMETLISAVQKLVIKDVVLYADNKINAATAVVYKAPICPDHNDNYGMAADNEQNSYSAKKHRSRR